MNAVGVYLQRHAQTALASLGRLWRTPVATLLTVTVLAIALALPAGLWVLLENARSVAGGWDAGTRISLYLRLDAPTEAAPRLADRLRADPDVARVQVIGRETALAEFRRHSGFGPALEALDDNPLPDVVVVEPATRLGAAEVAGLVRRLAGMPQVDLAQHDEAWLQRLHAMLDLARRGVSALAGLLAVAVLLIVGNTIRLDIYNRRDEIEVSKLVGATDAFIRRPFLYGGAWYGLAGGVLAWVIVAAALWLLDGPARHLATLYGSGFALRGLDLEAIGTLLGAGIALGLGGSWIAVARHLREIEPQ